MLENEGDNELKTLLQRINFADTTHLEDSRDLHVLKNSLGPPFQNLFQIPPCVHDGDHLKRDGFGPINDHIIGKFRDGPESHRARRYSSRFFHKGVHSSLRLQPLGASLPQHFDRGVSID